VVGGCAAGEAGGLLTTPHPTTRRSALREVALLFLKLGTVAFGGPAAHLGMMEDEVVRRRGWLTREEFLDLVGATNLIPGPNSTELAIHVGHRRAGRAGLIVAGVCFIGPAVLIVGALAWGYVRFGSVPAAQGLLAGVQPVVIAVILQALWRLGRTALKTPPLWALAVAAMALTLIGVNELIVLFGAGALWLAIHASRSTRRPGAEAAVAAVPLWAALPSAPEPSALTAATAVTAATAAFSATTLFLVFLKVGAVLFGSGYVLLAFLRADFVDRLGWLTDAQLLEAVAVGQVTPGPVFTTATFIGYLLHGPTGAVLATVGIFLPAFAFVAVSAPLVPRLRASPAAGAFLDAVNVASLALMAAVTWHLARHALTGVPGIALAALALVLLRARVNPAWLVLGGAGIGPIILT
jgi:chromate transporter